ncbi:hypothetical protein HUG15_20235 [Salicibibacter cibarius]|uniref:Uncharacterized protein n=1 Tax=Salicibibacter cibarius TaxID=2743000 RepID=A0A7T6Z640_9BACI|nr:hypothetical protein [Salicibibacter cibarius]QQK77683.1 hypothetical protein HUG15_20235 [Salicibibacter cibarius]
MKLPESKEESKESFHVSRFLSRGINKVRDPATPKRPVKYKRRDLYFKYEPGYFNQGTGNAYWQYYAKDYVQKSRENIDYARVSKMLGAMSLEFSPGCLLALLRIISVFFLWLLFILFFAFPTIVLALESSTEDPWEMYVLGSFFLIFYMFCRLFVETILYFFQNKRAKALIKEINLFQHETSVLFMHKYLNRQLLLYIGSYILVIAIVFYLAILATPPGGVD